MFAYTRLLFLFVFVISFVQEAQASWLKEFFQCCCCAQQTPVETVNSRDVFDGIAPLESFDVDVEIWADSSSSSLSRGFFSGRKDYEVKREEVITSEMLKIWKDHIAVASDDRTLSFKDGLIGASLDLLRIVEVKVGEATDNQPLVLVLFQVACRKSLGTKFVELFKKHNQENETHVDFHTEFKGYCRDNFLDSDKVKETTKTFFNLYNKEETHRSGLHQP